MLCGFGHEVHAIMFFMHDALSRLRGLDLDQLVYLDAMLRLRSVSRAADAMGLTQSAMSHALRRLRVRFDDPLLVRVGGGMAPTPFAEQLRPGLRAALVALQRALERAGPFDPAAEARTFRIASPDLFDLLVLPTLIRRMRAAGTRLSVQVTSYGLPSLQGALAQGDLDLALLPVLSGGSPLDGGEFMRRTLFRDGFRCFFRADHPVNSDWGLDGWLAADHLLVSPTGRSHGVVDRVLEQQGRRRSVALQVQGFGVAPGIVADSDLVLTAPASLARVTRPLGIVDREPPVPLPTHGIAMLWHRRFGEEPGLRWLMDQLAAVTCGLVPWTGTP